MPLPIRAANGEGDASGSPFSGTIDCAKEWWYIRGGERGEMRSAPPLEVSPFWCPKMEVPNIGLVEAEGLVVVVLDEDDDVDGLLCLR